MAEEQIVEPPQPVPEAETNIHETEIQPAKAQQTNSGPRWQRFQAWYTERKKWTVPASVLLLILILAGIPFTRYTLAGVVLKRDISIKVVDATTNTPVSGATVSAGSKSSQTDGSGKATLRHIKVGSQTILITKKYYKDRKASVLNPILKEKTVPAIALTATGRQVQITVTNLINKSSLGGVDIRVADVSAKTDKSGKAIVVLPIGVSQQKAHLSLNGYNDADVTVKVSNDKIQDNPFTLTPTGKIYFLSKLSGKIDVVKTNLDGTDRKTVLAGTGKEDDQNTVLLATRDWKYLALLSKRAGGTNPSLYLIDTSDDSLSTIDEGNADFGLSGWVDDNFIYTVTRSDVQQWQNNHQVLKSFNAPAKKLTTLAQTTGSGTNIADYVSQSVGGVYGYDSLVYYTLSWNSGYGVTSISNKSATFNSVKPDGTANKAIKSFAPPAGTTVSFLSLNEVIENPDKVHLEFSDGADDNFYIYTGGQVKADSNGTNENFYNANYSTYLLSPDSNNTFWSEPRDGKNTLFIGDQDGQNGKQIATLSEYNTYGWYTDNYLLVSKNSSELYIMDNAGKQTPVKISDYHKPAQTFNGYGGGYGGI